MCLFAGLFACFPVKAFDLISPKEAERPDDLAAIEAIRAGPLPDPDIAVHGPTRTTSPLSLVIEIKPFADARINTDSLLVLYLKKPRINLLPRIRRFIDASRRTVVIRLDNAEAPPGTHWIVFHVKDSRQQIAEQILKLEVLPGDTQAVPASPPAESTLGSPADPTGITERAHP